MTTSELGLALVGVCVWGLVIGVVVRERMRARRDARERGAEIKAQAQLLRRLQSPRAPARRKVFTAVGLFFLGLTLFCVIVGVWSGASVLRVVKVTALVLAIVCVLIVLPLLWLWSRRPWLHNLRRPSPITDAQLGKLRFSFGFETCTWRGSVALLPGTKARLSIVGSSDGPDPEALSMAKELAAQLPSWQTEIQQALFEHYEPYAEALASGELKRRGDPLPSITKPSDVWPLVSWVEASIIPVGGDLAVELRLFVPWDEEHTLGLLFKRGKLVDFCGSVGA